MASLGVVSGHVIGPSALPAIGSSVIAHNIQGLPGTDQWVPDYTTNSIISIDGKYLLNLPPGLYRFTVAFPDWTNRTINNYAVWPGSPHSPDFKYEAQPHALSEGRDHITLQDIPTIIHTISSSCSLARTIRLEILIENGGPSSNPPTDNSQPSTPTDNSNPPSTTTTNNQAITCDR